MSRTAIKTLDDYTFYSSTLEDLEDFISYVKEHTVKPSREINLDFYFNDKEDPYISAWFEYEMTEEEWNEKRKKEQKIDRINLEYHKKQVELLSKKLKEAE